jgi:hypothetical protein
MKEVQEIIRIIVSLDQAQRAELYVCLQENPEARSIVQTGRVAIGCGEFEAPVFSEQQREQVCKQLCDIDANEFGELGFWKSDKAREVETRSVEPVIKPAAKSKTTKTTAKA